MHCECLLSALWLARSPLLPVSLTETLNPYSIQAQTRFPNLGTSCRRWFVPPLIPPIHEFPCFHDPPCAQAARCLHFFSRSLLSRNIPRNAFHTAYPVFLAPLAMYQRAFCDSEISSSNNKWYTSQYVNDVENI